MLFVCVGFCFFEDLNGIVFGTSFRKEKFVLSFDYCNTSSLGSINLSQNAVSFLLNFLLDEVDFLNVQIMLSRHELLKVISLELKELFVLIVVDH